MTTLVEYTRTDAVATVTFNNSARLNTVNRELLSELHSVIDAIIADDSIAVVVLTGAGKAFCAGADLALGPGGAITAGDTPERALERMRTFMDISYRLHSMPAVTISAVNGACAGAGLSLACATDLRFASASARFNTAYIGAGLPGDFGGTWLLPRIVGQGNAVAKYLLSEPFDAEEALRISLVARVFPHEELLSATMEVAQKLASSAPLALRLMKQNLLDGIGNGFAEHLDIEAARHVFCVNTSDAAEAAAAFVEKRVPSFSGS